MPAPERSAFFSYSREDTDFSLRLAGDLKAAGAVVWLDQLDIAAGQRWDAAVEAALKDCPRLLLILSPSSVGSENVKDEVSFALDTHKTIIPVLYRDCEVPFRLRRFQYIDFRTDYPRGLEELLKILQASPAGKSTAADPEAQKPGGATRGTGGVSVGPSGTGAVLKPGEEALPRQAMRSAGPSASSSRVKYAVLGAVILAAAAVLYFVLSSNGPRITSLSESSGPAGSKVTISGKNFGAIQGGSTVKFGDTVAPVSSWSDTSSVVTVPEVSVGPVKVVASVKDKDSAPVTYTVNGPPSITSLSRPSAPPGTAVTISGANFGGAPGNGKVAFGIFNATITHWSENSVTATVPDLRPGTENIVVSVNGVNSLPASFAVTGNNPKEMVNKRVVNSAEYQHVKDRLTQTQAQVQAIVGQWNRTAAEVARNGGLLRSDEQTALNLLRSSMSSANRSLQAGDLAGATHSMDTVDQQIKLLQQYAE